MLHQKFDAKPEAREVPSVVSIGTDANVRQKALRIGLLHLQRTAAHDAILTLLGGANCVHATQSSLKAKIALMKLDARLCLSTLQSS